jgi:hypothetical protein
MSRESNSVTPVAQPGGEHTLLARQHDNDSNRVCRLDVYYVFALEISNLASPGDWQKMWDKLIHMRADVASAKVAFGKFEQLNAVSGIYADDIKSWMRDAERHSGKAIWTNSFLNDEAPFELRISMPLMVDGRPVQGLQRVREQREHDLNRAKFINHSMKLYREGVLTYTAAFHLVPAEKSNGSPPEPLTVESSIVVLNKLEGIARGSFEATVKTWLNDHELQSKFRTIFDVKLDLKCDMNSDDFKKRSKAHRLLVLDSFIRPDTEAKGGEFEGWTEVDPQIAIQNHGVAGLLNSADWFRQYRDQYLKVLAEKNIGYRSDEIYVTDRKASLASNKGFWEEDNPLQQYRLDILLSVEYWLARLAQTHAMLSFLQEHKSIREISTKIPAQALDTVVIVKRAVARLHETLDPARLIDHGFTTAFMNRLRQEMGLDTLLSFISERVDDAATGLSLRSAVFAEGVTAKRTLKIAIWTLVFTVIVLVATVAGVAIALDAEAAKSGGSSTDLKTETITTTGHPAPVPPR